MSLAAVRPDSWNFPLLLHVLGAMVLVALLAVAVVVLSAALRSDDRAAALRLAFRTLLIGAIPAYLVMRVAPSGSPRRRASRTPTSPGSTSATRSRTAGCWC